MQAMLAILLVFFLGVLSSSLVISLRNSDGQIKTSSKPIKSTYYTCPMHSHIHEEHAGSCPICGMSLISRQKENFTSKMPKNAEHAEVFIHSSVINNLSIKTTGVRKGKISKKVKIYGYVNQVNNTKIYDLRSPVSGSIKMISQTMEGEQLFKEQPILMIESDEILKLQTRYLSAFESKDNRSLKSIQQRLSSLDFSRQQLQTLVETRQTSGLYTLRSPAAGLLSELNIKVGDPVSSNDLIATLLPIYSISVYSDIFETQWVWLKPEQSVTMVVRNFPGISWQGKVRNVEELVGSSTSSVKLYADFKTNDRVDLRLGMQTEMVVEANLKNEVLLVPSSAVIRSENKSIVVVAKENGHFQPVDVITGLEDDESVEIISGLELGMGVVVSGQFLLDSESQIKSGISRMSSPDLVIEH